MVFIGLDDARWDDVYARLVSGSFGENYRMSLGQSATPLAMQTYTDLLVAKGTSFAHHRVTLGPCWTARCEWHTALYAPNHGMTQNTAQFYQDKYVNGIKTTGFLRTTAQWMGPYGKDLAAQAGLARQRVSHATQTSLGVLRDSDDDLQAFTGSLFQWLARENVHCGIFGKFQNPMGQTDIIPAGVSEAHIQLVGDNVTNYYTATYLELADDPTGHTNPYNGNGATPTLRSYGYNFAISAASWSSTAGGTAHITAAGHGLNVGDQVGVQVTTQAGYNGFNFTVTAATSNTFDYLVAGPLSSASGGQVYNRQQYSAIQLGHWVEDFINARGDAESFFAYVAPHQPHSTTTGDYSSATEKMYAGSVDPTDAIAWNGVAGQNSPVGAVPITSGQQDTWRGVNELLCSVDDMLGIIIGALEARWGDDWTICFTSDQGIQNGDQSARGQGSVKTGAWESSARSMCVWRGPDWAQNVVNTTQQTVHADLALTILDVFGLTDHHAHVTRDGRSLLRVTDSADLSHNRSVLILGDFKTGAGQGRVDKLGVKYLRIGTNDTTGFYFYPDVDYELNQYDEFGNVGTPSSGARNLTGSSVDALIAARFVPATDANPCHTLT